MRSFCFLKGKRVKIIKIISVIALILTSFGCVCQSVKKVLRQQGVCIHGGFQGLYKPCCSPDEQFIAKVSAKGGLIVTNNDNQEVVLKVNTVEVKDFGFSSDSRYFFVDYLSGQRLRARYGQSIDVFDLHTCEIILTIPHYSLFSASRHNKAAVCDFNEFVEFACKNNIFTIWQKSFVRRKIVEIRDISLVKYCNGSEFFVCIFKSGAMKLFETNNIQIKELCMFFPYSYKNPERSFFKPDYSKISRE